MANDPFTDEQLSQIRAVVSEVGAVSSSGYEQSLSEHMDALSASISADIDESVPLAVASALESRSGTAQVVALTDEQMAAFTDYQSFCRDSLTLQNALLLFTLLFSASLLGMRFFSEFSRGFRRG